MSAHRVHAHVAHQIHVLAQGGKGGLLPERAGNVGVQAVRAHDVLFHIALEHVVALAEVEHAVIRLAVGAGVPIIAHQLAYAAQRGMNHRAGTVQISRKKRYGAGQLDVRFGNGRGNIVGRRTHGLGCERHGHRAYQQTQNHHHCHQRSDRLDRLPFELVPHGKTSVL